LKFIDFLTFIASALAIQVFAESLPNEGRYKDVNIAISIKFTNGSIGTINYVANDDKAFPKERMEVFGGGTVAVLDNFRQLELMRAGQRKVLRSWLGQDKGHQGEWEAVVSKIRSGQDPPILFDEIVLTSLCSFSIVKSFGDGSPVLISRTKI
jgi:hypothetical protein